MSEISLVSVRAARRSVNVAVSGRTDPLSTNRYSTGRAPLVASIVSMQVRRNRGSVAKGNDDADQGVGSNGPPELERVRVEPRRHVPRLVPAFQCVAHVVGVRSIPARIERGVAEHLGDVHRALALSHARRAKSCSNFMGSRGPNVAIRLTTLDPTAIGRPMYGVCNRNSGE